MARYWIDKPCSYAVDGAVTLHKRGGVVVELAEEVAAGLGNAVRKVVEALEEEGVLSTPVPEPAPVVEPVAEVVPDPVVEPEVSVSSPRSRRPKTEGSDGDSS